jgi:hypothetical protein
MFRRACALEVPPVLDIGVEREDHIRSETMTLCKTLMLDQGLPTSPIQGGPSMTDRGMLGRL